MATRRPAPPTPGKPPRQAFAVLSRRWALAALSVAGLISGLALPAPAAAQYMALTAPAPTPSQPPVPQPARPVPPVARAAEHAFNGSLPNQRTGPSRQRVVRDICIGCDR